MVAKDKIRVMVTLTKDDYVKLRDKSSYVGMSKSIALLVHQWVNGQIKLK